MYTPKSVILLLVLLPRGSYGLTITTFCYYAPTLEGGRQRRALGKSLQQNKVHHCTVRPIDENQGQTLFLHNRNQRDKIDEHGQSVIC